VFAAVWAVANGCRVVVGRREHTQVYAAVGGGVGLGRWPYALGIRLPRGPDGCTSQSSRPLGIVVAVYASRNSWLLGGGGPVGTCVGTRGRLEGLWLVAGSQDRGPAVAEVWVGVGLAEFSGSKPCPRGF